MPMRLTYCLFLLFACLTAFGNMASPYQRGTLTAAAISSKDIDVVSEQIIIRLSPNGDSAYYNVTYTVRTDTSGKQIPLLFVAKNYAGKFSVTVNGQSIAISNAVSLTKLSAYSALKEESNAAGTSYTIELQWDSTDRRTYPLSDLIYFEVDLSKGVHEIKVEYTASASYDGSGWVKQYFHRYSLSPAKYWRTFGRLDVTLVTNPVNGTTTTNLGIPAKGSLKNKAEWIFTSLPAGWIEVQYEPIISSTAQMLINVTPEGIACIALLILFFIHL
jgi:hypothetical protein